MRPLVQVQPGPLAGFDLRKRSSVVFSIVAAPESPAHSGLRTHPSTAVLDDFWWRGSRLAAGRAGRRFGVTAARPADERSQASRLGHHQDRTAVLGVVCGNVQTANARSRSSTQVATSVPLAAPLSSRSPPLLSALEATLG